MNVRNVLSVPVITLNQPNFQFHFFSVQSSSSRQVRHDASGALFTVTAAPAANTQPGVFKKKQLSKQLGPLLRQESLRSRGWEEQ